ncbi:hypothetical protein AC578_3422 [Pseudocercospora eumusae]|uniref:Uncharacterized protein n=1 Tax=Pseudocercospora eumusae TaxID=321146 RepID=A0A139HQU8_9PEZI|nr:hypothetical protein AC578_3422 [Pseudocercospora eumusae]
MHSNIAQLTTPATDIMVHLLNTLSYPITFVLCHIWIAILFLLNMLYLPIRLLLQPLVHFARFTLLLAAMPFHVAARFETLYIYLGVAAIVGLLGGVIVACVYSILYNFFDLETPPEPVSLRTAKQYRQEKQKQKLQSEHSSFFSPRLLSPAALSSGYGSLSEGCKGSLLATAIMEEEDSEF